MVNSSQSNYISRYLTTSTAYSLYRGNISLVGGQELSELLFPGLLYELKTKITHSEMLSEVVTAPSRYVLPEYIDSDKLIEHIRSTLADVLVFIHTWIRTHQNDNNERIVYACKQIIETKWRRYEEFFESGLTTIINHESDSGTKTLARKLQSSMKTIYPYLGVFHGHLEDRVVLFRDVILTIILIYVLITYRLI